MSKTTEAELEKIMARPEYANRTAIRVYENGAGELTTEWDGHTVKGSNAFQIDSRLSDVGAPSPRNVFLMEDE